MVSALVRCLLFLLASAFGRTAAITFRSIKAGINGIEIFAVQIILCDAESFTETGRLK